MERVSTPPLDVLEAKYKKKIAGLINRMTLCMVKMKNEVITLQNKQIIFREVIMNQQIMYKATTDKRTYSVAEIMEILEIGRNKAYELCNSNAFNIVRIGKLIRVSKSSFDAWLDKTDIA